MTSEGQAIGFENSRSLVFHQPMQFQKVTFCKIGKLSYIYQKTLNPKCGQTDQKMETVE